MKCEFLVDTDTELDDKSEEHKALLKSRVVKSAHTGQPRIDYYWPKGTVVELDSAWQLVDYGVAKPADDECAARCRPMSPEDRAKLEKEYVAATLGIHDANDLDLFMRDIIAGYEPVNGKYAYKPGPRWAEYVAEQEAKKKEDEGI